MNSGSVATPSEDATDMKNGCSPTKPTGTKGGALQVASWLAGRAVSRTRKRGHIERVAVGRGSGGCAGRDHATGARMVQRKHLPAPHLREAVGDDPQQRVRRTAGRRMGGEPQPPRQDNPRLALP